MARSVPALLLAAVLLLPAVVTAQIADPDTLYDGGTVGFDYAQTPFPWYSGTFLAEGPGLEPDGSWPEGATAVAGGAIATAGTDTVLTVIYGLAANPDGTVDGALAVVMTDGQPAPGTYPVDPQAGTAIFGFVDDAESLALPDTLSQEAVLAWLEDLSAAHKLVSLNGSITLAVVDAGGLEGTFSGLCADYDDPLFLVNVTGGHFALTGAGATPVDETPGPVAAALVARPNPFNPRTVIALTAPVAGRGELVVFDLRGRPVRRLHAGEIPAGRSTWEWNGRDDAGRPLASGVYLVRARTAAGPVRTKVVLAK